MSDSYELYERFRNTRITIEELGTIQDTVSDVCRWYLLGKLCYDESASDIKMAKVSIFEKLRGTFGLTDGSYRRLMKFKIAVDRLHQLVPELMPRIIDGNARLSMDNAMAVSKWEPEIIRAALEKLRDRTVNMSHIFNEYPNSGLGVRKYNRVASEHRQTVKDTPAFDPEAQISGICYTIPSWAAAVDRAFTATEFVNVSLTVRHKFVRELTALRDTVQTVLDILKEGD